jgi:hypothetical protein
MTKALQRKKKFLERKKVGRVVEHPTHQPKVEGLSPATATGTLREKIEINFWGDFIKFYVRTFRFPSSL